jgi:hypothetical protein
MLVSYSFVSLAGARRYDQISGSDNMDFAYSQYRRIALWSVFCFNLTTCTIKLSLLATYRRILIKEKFRYIVDVLLVSVVLYGFSCVLITLLQCQPLNYFYNFVLPGSKGKCINSKYYLMAESGLNVFFNLIITLIPIRIIQLLPVNTPMQTKVAVSALFGMGIFALLSSILRMYSLYALTWTMAKHPWELDDYWIWSLNELNVGVICAALPACRKLLVKWKNRISAKQSETWKSRFSRRKSSNVTSLNIEKHHLTMNTPLQSGTFDAEARFKGHQRDSSSISGSGLSLNAANGPEVPKIDRRGSVMRQERYQPRPLSTLSMKGQKNTRFTGDGERRRSSIKRASEARRLSVLEDENRRMSEVRRRSDLRRRSETKNSGQGSDQSDMEGGWQKKLEEQRARRLELERELDMEREREKQLELEMELEKGWKIHDDAVYNSQEADEDDIVPAEDTFQENFPEPSLSSRQNSATDRARSYRSRLPSSIYGDIPDVSGPRSRLASEVGVKIISGTNSGIFGPTNPIDWRVTEDHRFADDEDEENGHQGKGRDLKEAYKPSENNEPEDHKSSIKSPGRLGQGVGFSPRQAHGHDDAEDSEHSFGNREDNESGIGFRVGEEDWLADKAIDDPKDEEDEGPTSGKSLSPRMQHRQTDSPGPPEQLYNDHLPAQARFKLDQYEMNGSTDQSDVERQAEKDEEEDERREMDDNVTELGGASNGKRVQKGNLWYGVAF